MARPRFAVVGLVACALLAVILLPVAALVLLGVALEFWRRG
jgi:hypothetical protein